MKTTRYFTFVLLCFVMLTLVSNNFAQGRNVPDPTETEGPITHSYFDETEFAILPPSAWVLDFPGSFREYAPPESSPRDFVGRVCMPVLGRDYYNWVQAGGIAPVASAVVTITDGPRTGQQVVTDKGGYYHFKDIAEDELQLSVEREWIESKEVIVYRSHPTVLQRLGPNEIFNAHHQEREGQDNAPGTILVGVRWPDACRPLIEENPMPHDLLFVLGIGGLRGDGLPPRAGGGYGSHLVSIFTHPEEKDRIPYDILFHEIAHARQHAVAIQHGGNEIDHWYNTPEAKAYEKAREKDLEEVTPNDFFRWLDEEGVHHSSNLIENAGEFCAIYWGLLEGRIMAWHRSVYRDGGIRKRAPNRFKWAETYGVDAALPIASITKGIHIPDTNLAATLRETLGLAPNAPITQLDMLELEKLIAVDRQITTLTGLEHAININKVNLLYNQVDDITPLAKLTHLRDLNISGNQVRDIMPLKDLNNIFQLHIGKNPISDITVLLSLKNLDRLYLSNPIRDISPLWKLTQLQDLSIRFMKIDDISPLAKFTKLILLQLDDNEISDITPLSNLTNLQHLFIWRNPITDVSPLAELTNLAQLHLEGLPIKNRKPLLALLRKNPEVKIFLTWDGEPLPVSLSHFRAEHTDTGVILNWTTESELNNAGFYIYRSETRDSTFKVVNPTLIQGAGTTSERHTYTWTDTTAKPNTVYYYRIEDISHAGVRKPLATVRLRGLISAKGKMATQWADFKTGQ